MNERRATVTCSFRDKLQGSYDSLPRNHVQVANKGQNLCP